MEEAPRSFRSIIWGNIIFFIITTILGTVGTAWYVSHYGISVGEWFLFGFYMIVTGLGITVGYHRLYAHASYKASLPVRFFVLFFGAAAFEQSALRWASQHRDHHRYVDTDLDPYSIKKGFWYAHIGWLMFWRHLYNFDNAKDLQKSRMLMNQDKYYYLWSVGAGILLPVLLGLLAGGHYWIGALCLVVGTRITLVYHATFCINSVCHMFGKAPYDPDSSAKDHWFVALMTYGEGYHNFHHRFPSDYRNAIRWYQWDPSKWMIALLSKAGLVKDLKKVSNFRILEARLAADHQLAHRQLEAWVNHPNYRTLAEKVKTQYDQLRNRLVEWEKQVKTYQEMFRSKVLQARADQFDEMVKNAKRNMAAAHETFQENLQQWRAVLNLVYSV